MRRVFLSVFAFVGLASAVHADGNAQLRAVPYVPPTSVTPPPPGGCPYAVDNGCAAAIAGQPGSTTVKYGRQVSGGMLQQLTGSTTDETQNPNNINEPGVDYEVGEWTALTSLKDPLDPTVGIHATNPGCVYVATGGINSGPQMNCTGSAAVDIENYDMTRGGTTCIPLSILTGGSTTIKGNYWLNNGKCVATDYHANGTGTLAMLYLQNQTGPTELAYNTLDANNQAFPYYYGSCSPPGSFQSGSTGCNPQFVFMVQGPLYAHHNFFKNFRGDLFQYYQTGTGFPNSLLDIRYNMVQGCCGTIPTDHAEFIGFQGLANVSAQQSAGYKLIGNTIIETTDHMNNGNGGIPDMLHAGSFIPNWDLEDNLAIYGTTGGSTRQVVVGGTASGSTFTTSTTNAISPETTGTFGSGMKIECHVTGHDTDQFFFMSVYNGGTNTISAGPAGGGHSTPGNPVSAWAMTMYGGFATMGASLSGNTLTVTRPTITISVGSGGFIPGVGLSYTVTALGTGTGGAGTYTVNVSGNQADEDGVQIFPNGGNQFPGGWTVAPGVTIPCYGSGWGGPSGTAPNRVATQRAIGFTNAAFALLAADGPGGARAGTVVKRNTFDLYGYGPNADQGVNIVNSNDNGGAIIFNGTITSNGASPATLTCNSGSCSQLGVSGPRSGGIGYGNGLLIGSSWPGVLRGTYIISGSNGVGPWTLSIPYPSTVGPMSMRATQTICTDHPTVFGNNVAIDAVYPGYGNLNSWGGDKASPGDGC